MSIVKSSLSTLSFTEISVKNSANILFSNAREEALINLENKFISVNLSKVRVEYFTAE